MQTKLSTKGQVVVPGRIRRKLGLQPGDSLDAEVEGERIVLTPQSRRRQRLRIVKDPATGLPVLAAAAGVLKLTSREVSEILSEFP